MKSTPISVRKDAVIILCSKPGPKKTETQQGATTRYDLPPTLLSQGNWGVSSIRSGSNPRPANRCTIAS